jgi:hypothetical protein
MDEGYHKSPIFWNAPSLGITEMSFMEKYVNMGVRGGQTVVVNAAGITRAAHPARSHSSLLLFRNAVVKLCTMSCPLD